MRRQAIRELLANINEKFRTSMDGMRVVSGLSLFFFFSSRRRHTRSDRDWSSDVCSSDLFEDCWTCSVAINNLVTLAAHTACGFQIGLDDYRFNATVAKQSRHCLSNRTIKIGRASCRERV